MGSQGWKMRQLHDMYIQWFLLPVSTQVPLNIYQCICVYEVFDDKILQHLRVSLYVDELFALKVLN